MHVVIVVDDDRQVREALEGLLLSADFGAEVYSSAEELLQAGVLGHASCLVTDVRMPGMPGIELQRYVKREYPRLPVVLITGHRDERLRQDALAEGAVDVFFKPIDPDHFLQAIRAALSD